MLSHGKRALIGYGYEQAEGTHLSVSNTINGDVRISISDIGGDLVSSGKNLFDKSKATIGFRLNENGNLVARADRFVTDFMPVLPNTVYKNSHYAANISFYMCEFDINKNLIKSQVSSDAAFTTSANAVYYRNTVVLTALDVYQFEIGAVTTTYNSFAGIDIVPITTTEHSIKTYKGFTQVYATEGQTLSGIFRVKKGG